GVVCVGGGTGRRGVRERRVEVMGGEGPLNDDRALAVINEPLSMVPNKPIKYLIVSHHHFDHSGGVRAFAGEGATLIIHDASKAYLEKVVAASATVSPDHLAKSGKKAAVEG